LDLDRLRNFSSHHHEPFVGFTLKAKSLDRSLNLNGADDTDLANVLYSQSVAFESDSVAVTWVKNRVEPVGAFESRVARFLTGFDTSKEVLERFIPIGDSSAT
jgi:hypothetical protein